MRQRPIWIDPSAFYFFLILLCSGYKVYHIGSMPSKTTKMADTVPKQGRYSEAEGRVNETGGVFQVPASTLTLIESVSTPSSLHPTRTHLFWSHHTLICNKAHLRSTLLFLTCFYFMVLALLVQIFTLKTP